MDNNQNLLPPPPPSPHHMSPASSHRNSSYNSPIPRSNDHLIMSFNTNGGGYWERVGGASVNNVPCQRSLHAGAVWHDLFLVFGGYDGHHRINDLYAYHFRTNYWQLLSPVRNQNAPTPRDRHVATVYDNFLYIFGGFDGLARVNDLHAFDLEENEWQQVVPSSGAAPSPRHSHAAIVYQNSMYIFGGYDGSYRNDFHEFNFLTNSWSAILITGEVPRARYRGTCVVSGDTMILHGGHDGNRHLQDTWLFDFTTRIWTNLITEGFVPSPRDSHIAVIHGKSMFLYGGSTGSAMGDFHELKLGNRNVWAQVSTSSSNGRDHGSSLIEGGVGRAIGSNNNSVSSSIDLVESISPGARFCHVGVVDKSALYIFGGYDGSNRLNDFLRYRFDQGELEMQPTPSTILSDLKTYVNSDLLSDIKFIVDGRVIYAHKILCLRCPFFHNMLTGEYMESRATEVPIHNVKYSTFIQILEYLYSDHVEISTETAMDLFQAADMFGIDRLKKLCEQEMLRAINIETAAQILFTADERNAENLRNRCLNFILTHFDECSRTAGFEEMGRTNVELVFEILRKR